MTKDDAITFEIHFGICHPKIKEQLEKQGFRWKRKADVPSSTCENMRDIIMRLQGDTDRN